MEAPAQGMIESDGDDCDGSGKVQPIPANRGFLLRSVLDVSHMWHSL